MSFFGTFRRGLRPLPRLLAIGALGLPLAACDLDNILDVRDPAQVTPPELDNEESVPFLVNGAIRQFYGGYSGWGDDSFLIAGATLTDELYNGDSFLTRMGADLRKLQPPLLGNFSDASFARLHNARVLANRAASNVDRFTPDDNASFALMKAIEGYTYVTLAEGWCGSLPFSAVPETGPLDPNTLPGGTPISTNAAFDAAVAIFDQGIARAPASTDAGRLARVGKARALLNRGNYAGAAAALAGVPSGYSFSIEHSSNEGTQNNPVFNLIANGRYGVSEDEGGLQRHDLCAPASLNPPTVVSTVTCADSIGWGTDEGEGMPFRSAMDPRVPWAYGGGSFTGSIRRFWPLEHFFEQYDADVYLVDPAEVDLIRAEAQLAAGDAGWLTTLNDLRADEGLGALTDPGTANGRVLLLFRERAFWLFLTGHRQGDLRRLVRNYGFNEADVWPTGTNLIRNQAYGNDVAFPLPFNETNNAEFDPATCITTQA